MPIIVSGCVFVYIRVLDVWVLLGNITWFVVAAIIRRCLGSAFDKGVTIYYKGMLEISLFKEILFQNRNMKRLT